MFNLIKINITSIFLFPDVEDEATMDTNLTHGDKFPAYLLSSTEWADFTNSIIGNLIPNFFLAYFGQQLAYRDLADDNVMAKLTCLGFGYEPWANIAKDDLNNLDGNLNIMEDVNTPNNIKKYFNLSLDENKSHCLATSNGPFGTMTIVQSDEYPVAAHAIKVKDLLQLTPQAATSPAVFPPGNAMLQLPGKIDKVSKANKGIIKLMLLHIHGNININSTSITNVTLATPSKGMQVVLNQPRAAQARQIADLVWMKLDLAKQQEYTNICSS